MKQLNLGKIEMQIPKENSYNNLTISRNFDDEFNKLSNYYDIEESNKLKNFMKKHENTLDFIHEITPLINEYFPNYDKVIEFCEDPEFKDLDFIMIYIKGNNYQKDELILEKFEKEPLYKSKFTKNIYGLVCVELW